MGTSTPPGVDVLNGGSFVKRAQRINFSSGVTDPGGVDVNVAVGGGGAGSGVNTQDEGAAVDSPATTLNFVGAGVKAAGGAGTTTVNIPGCVADVLANRPAAASTNQGELFFATDTGVLYISTGAAWTTITPSIAGGGTGATTQQGALDAIAGAVTNNQVLAGNGTHVTLRSLASADIPNLDFSKITTGTVPINQGGTGQTTAQAAFDALSPLTTAGDIIVESGGHNARLAVGNNWQELGVTAGAPAYKNRSRALLATTVAAQGNLGTNTSVMGMTNILSSGEIQVGDIFRIRVGFNINNQSAGSATMNVGIAMRNNGGTAVVFGTSVSTSVATVTQRNGWIDLVAWCNSINAGNGTIQFTYQYWSNTDASGANAIVVASTNSGTSLASLVGSGATNGAIDLDFVASSSVTAANVQASAAHLTVEKVSL